MTEPNYWLMKSEPDAYSIDSLRKDGVTLWDGIRNYQARNYMRKMEIGDKVFFIIQIANLLELLVLWRLLILILLTQLNF